MDNTAPGDLEQGRRPGLGRLEQCRERLGPALQVAFGVAADFFTSTRFELTPMRTLARKPERSSPRQVVSPSVGAPARYSGREVISK